MKVSGRTEWVSDELFELRRQWNAELLCTKSADDIRALWNAHGEQFSNVNVATALLSFSQAHVNQDCERCIRAMVEHYVATPNEVKLRNAAGIIYALSHMQFKSQEALRARVDVFELVKQKVIGEEAFFEGASSLSIVRLLQGYAFPGANGEAVFTATESVVKKLIYSCKPGEVVNIAVAYSKKNCRNEAILTQIEQLVLSRRSLYEPAELAHLAYAFSMLGFGSQEFYQTVYVAIGEHITSLNAKAILYCLDAFRGRTQNVGFVPTIAGVIRDIACDLASKDLSLILNAFTKTRFGDDSFFEEMEEVVIKLLPTCNCHDLATFAVAFARALAGGARFYSKLRMAIIKQLQLFSPAALTMIYYSFSVSSMVNREFFCAIEERLVKSQLESKDVVVVLWSMLLSGRRERGPLSHFIGLLNKACDGKGLATSKQNRNKLIECSAILNNEMPDLYETLSKDVLLEIEQARSDRSEEPTDRSPFQEEVETALARCGVVFEVEYSLEGYFVDVFIPSLKHVIEVNGRPHYYRADPEKLNATSLMKQRILEASGYRVSTIAHFEWPDRKEITAQNQFIKKLLRPKT